MGYDIESARRDGISEQDIQAHLASKLGLTMQDIYESIPPGMDGKDLSDYLVYQEQQKRDWATFKKAGMKDEEIRRVFDGTKSQKGDMASFEGPGWYRAATAGLAQAHAGLDQFGALLEKPFPTTYFADRAEYQRAMARQLSGAESQQEWTKKHPVKAFTATLPGSAEGMAQMAAEAYITGRLSGGALNMLSGAMTGKAANATYAALRGKRVVTDSELALKVAREANAARMAAMGGEAMQGPEAAMLFGATSDATKAAKLAEAIAAARAAGTVPRAAGLPAAAARMVGGVAGGIASPFSLAMGEQRAIQSWGEGGTPSEIMQSGARGYGEGVAYHAAAAIPSRIPRMGAASVGTFGLAMQGGADPYQAGGEALLAGLTMFPGEGHGPLNKNQKQALWDNRAKAAEALKAQADAVERTAQGLEGGGQGPGAIDGKMYPWGAGPTAEEAAVMRANGQAVPSMSNVYVERTSNWDSIDPVTRDTLLRIIAEAKVANKDPMNRIYAEQAKTGVPLVDAYNRAHGTAYPLQKPTMPKAKPKERAAGDQPVNLEVAAEQITPDVRARFGLDTPQLLVGEGQSLKRTLAAAAYDQMKELVIHRGTPDKATPELRALAAEHWNSLPRAVQERESIVFKSAAEAWKRLDPKTGDTVSVVSAIPTLSDFSKPDSLHYVMDLDSPETMAFNSALAEQGLLAGKRKNAIEADVLTLPADKLNAKYNMRDPYSNEPALGDSDNVVAKNTEYDEASFGVPSIDSVVSTKDILGPPPTPLSELDAAYARGFAYKKGKYDLSSKAFVEKQPTFIQTPSGFPASPQAVEAKMRDAGLFSSEEAGAATLAYINTVLKSESKANPEATKSMFAAARQLKTAFTKGSAKALPAKFQKVAEAWSEMKGGKRSPDAFYELVRTKLIHQKVIEPQPKSAIKGGVRPPPSPKKPGEITPAMVYSAALALHEESGHPLPVTRGGGKWVSPADVTFEASPQWMLAKLQVIADQVKNLSGEASDRFVDSVLKLEARLKRSGGGPDATGRWLQEGVASEEGRVEDMVDASLRLDRAKGTRRGPGGWGIGGKEGEAVSDAGAAFREVTRAWEDMSKQHGLGPLDEALVRTDAPRYDGATVVRDIPTTGSPLKRSADWVRENDELYGRASALAAKWAEAERGLHQFAPERGGVLKSEEVTPSGMPELGSLKIIKEGDELAGRRIARDEKNGFKKQLGDEKAGIDRRTRMLGLGTMPGLTMERVKALADTLGPADGRRGEAFKAALADLSATIQRFGPDNPRSLYKFDMLAKIWATFPEKPPFGQAIEQVRSAAETAKPLGSTEPAKFLIRDEKTGESLLTHKEIVEISDQFAKENGRKVVVGQGAENIRSIAPELPPETHDAWARYEQSGEGVQGAYHKGVIYLDSSNISTKAELITALNHETGHQLMAILMKKYPREMMDLLRDVYKNHTDIVNKVIGKQGEDIDIKTPEGRIMAAHEVWARMAQEAPEASTFQRFVAMVRRWVRMAYPKLEWTDADVNALIAKEFEGMKTGQLGETKVGLRSENIGYKDSALVARPPVAPGEAAYLALGQQLSAGDGNGAKFLVGAGQAAGGRDAVPDAIKAQLQAGGKEVYEKTVRPIAEVLTRHPSTFFERVVLGVAPYWRGATEFKEMMEGVPKAERAKRNATLKTAVESMTKMKNSRERIAIGLGQHLNSWKEVADGWTRDQSSALWDYLSEVNPKETVEQWAKRERNVDLPAGTQQLVDIIKAFDRGQFELLRVYFPTLNELDRHAGGVMWAKAPGDKGKVIRDVALPTAVGRVEGSLAFRKQRRTENFSAGVAKGGVPMTWNPVENFMLKYHDSARAITSQRMWRLLKEQGSVRFFTDAEALDGKIPKDWMPIRDAIASKMHQTDGEHAGRNGEAGRYYADPHVGTMFEHFLSRDQMRSWGPTRALLEVKNFATMIELVGPFHIMFEGGEAVISDVTRGIRLAVRAGTTMDPVAAHKAFDAFGTAVFAPFGKFKKSMFADGVLVKKMLNDPNFFTSQEGMDFLKRNPEAHENLGILIDHGMGTQREAFAGMSARRFTRIYKEYLEKGKADASIAGKAKDFGIAGTALPLSLIEHANNWLFEKYVPGIKLGAALREFETELFLRAKDIEGGKITKAEIASKVVGSLEDRFGEMNYSNLWWDRSFKSGLQIVLRSPTWRLGSIRALAKAGIDTAAFANDMAHMRMPKLTQPMVWGLFGVPIIHAMMSAIVNYAFTGTTPDKLTPEDWLFPRYDKLDDRNRLTLPDYMKDYYHLWKSGLGYMGSGLSYLPSALTLAATNRTYFGEKVYDPDASFAQQAKAVAQYSLPVPFVASSMWRVKKEGQPLPAVMMAALGMPKAPKAVSQTDAERIMSEYRFSQMPLGGRTQEQMARISDKTAWKSALNRGDTALANEIMANGLQKGTITFRNIRDAEKSRGVSSVLIDFKGLPIEVAQKVMVEASPEEYNLFFPEMLKKLSVQFKENPPRAEQTIKFLQEHHVKGF